ncbi:urea carboxylase-associated family protein [Aestuariibius sp. HNIBRBA575]|uniref:urea carboxylase-associated family protein n=1 Tax=Aestuariibius sp. HNIBRBA575 TaxID=3233343 RepID=UPI0034A4B6EB
MAQQNEPKDAKDRRGVKPVICYPTDTLPVPNMALYRQARLRAKLVDEIEIAPREAAAIHVPAGHFLRTLSVNGPQVGDLNLFNANNLSERFYSGKTRALHGSHVTTGDQLWSNFPTLRPMATLTDDTLNWYGIDEFGGSVHDVIGTRCDPYTGRLLGAGDYHHCCHSNLTRALADHLNVDLSEAEPHIHDVLNVFMCTGFTRETGQYFMKASPVRPGDYLEMFAEIDLLAVQSACPGGDCGSEHTSDATPCYPLVMQVFKPADGTLDGWVPPKPNAYSGSHGR